MTIKISPADAYTINLLVERMMEANSTSNRKAYDDVGYRCYSKALKAFLVELLGQEMYNDIEQLRYGFDWCDGKNACSMLRLWIDEVEQDKATSENNKKTDYVVEYLCNGKWHSIEDLSQLTTFTKTEVQYIFDEHILPIFEITMRRFDDGIKYKIID